MMKTMLQRIKAVPLTVLMLFVSLCAHAQDEPEYKAEIGVGL